MTVVPLLIDKSVDKLDGSWQIIVDSDRGVYATDSLPLKPPHHGT